MDRLSQRIVGFISNMHPLYAIEYVDGVLCARSLNDGELIVPINELEDDEGGRVTIHWLDDKNHTTNTSGIIMASEALVKYIKLRSKTGGKDAIEEIQEITHRLMAKTNKSLMSGLDAETAFFNSIAIAVGNLGPDEVLNIMKESLNKCGN